MKSILERALDRQALGELPSSPPVPHENLRGAAYFDLSSRWLGPELYSDKEHEC